MSLTPDTVQHMVESRLIQTFRQYPRAGLYLSSSFRNRLLTAISKNILDPAALHAYVLDVSDAWTLQTRIAFKDVFAYYADAHEPGKDAENIAILKAIAAGILAAGKIQ